MDGLEDRVRRALGAGALAADPSLVDVDAVHAGIARRRRRLAVLSTVAVVGLLGAGGALALNQHDKPKTVSVLSDPTPTPTATVEPTTRPTPSPAAPATTECASGDIALVSTNQTGAAGHAYTDVTVRNSSATSCLLSDAPGLSFSGSGTPDAVRHDGSIPGDGRRPALVAAGATAHVTLDAQNGCNGGANPTVFTHIQLVLKDGGTVAVPGTIESSCPLLVTDWYLLP